MQNFSASFFSVFSAFWRTLIFSPLPAKDSGLCLLRDLKEAFPVDLTECFPLSHNIGLTLKNLKEKNR